MGGIVGRFFREFAVVMSSAILVSMVVSLTTTPMMCAHLLRAPQAQGAPRGAWARVAAWLGRLERASQRLYRRTLAWSLRHQPLVLLSLAAVVALNVHLYVAIDKGFMPEQDTGRIMGFIRADQASSFQAMQQRIQRFLAIVQQDPAVEYVMGSTGGGQINAANMFMTLKPLAERKVSSDEVIDRLREKLAGERKDRPQRGSHIVLAPGRLPIDEAIIFMHPRDKRPLFIYPWEGRTVVGTTDLDHREDLDTEAAITAEETVYILEGVNSQFPEEKITLSDIIATWSGVRPIVASGNGVNPSAERRDHSVWDDAGLVTVTGGKLTTFRLIALDALRAASPYLAGVDVSDTKAPVFRAVGTVETPWPVADLMRLKGRFGFHVRQFLAESPKAEMEAIPQLETLWAELRWAARYEQVEHLDDLLLRRTRIGLLLPEGGSAHLLHVRSVCQTELGWDDSRWAAETERYADIWHRYYGLPQVRLSRSAAA